MKFFIDSSNFNEIQEALKWGIVDGVTTNPSLVAKSDLAQKGLSMKEVITEICKLLDGPVSAEVLATDFKNMLKEGEELAKISDNIVVKIPLTEDGIKTVVELSKQDIKTNVTLCFSTTQALIAAKAGASYISPFVGRLDDIATDGLQLIEEIITIYQNYGIKTEVLAASIRHPIHMKEVALMGADIATIPFSVLPNLIKHPLTDIGLEKFLKDGQGLNIF